MNHNDIKNVKMVTMKHDPLNRQLKVIRVFNWLGHKKIQAVDEKTDEYYTDWYYNFEEINAEC